MAVVSRQSGVVAGRCCAEETFRQVDSDLDVDWRLPDGSEVSPGSVVAAVSGRLRSILSAERTALNFLCHLSGVASATRRFVDAACAANPHTRILDTRKTTPGLRSLEKAAVRAGGGTNHRGNLSEAVLIKDNHLGGVGIADAVSRARALWPGRMVEVECDRMDQVVEATAARATVIMLDNMTPDQIADCVRVVHSRGHRRPGRGVGPGDPGDGGGLRGYRGGPHLGRRPDPLGPRARPGLRPGPEPLTSEG